MNKANDPCSILDNTFFFSIILFLMFGVYAYRHRTVVEELHLHFGAELARAYRFAECCAEVIAELLV